LDQQNIRLILFMVVAFTILMVYNGIFAPAPVPPVPGSHANVALSASPSPSSAAPAGSFAVMSPSAKPSTRPRSVQPVKSAAPAQVTVVTSLYKAALSNQGAVLTSYELTKFLNRHTKRPLDLVSADTDSPKPLALAYSPAGDLGSLNWELVGGAREIKLTGTEAATVTLRAQSAGAWVEKTVTFTNGSYVLGVTTRLRSMGAGLGPSELVLEGPSDLGHEEFTGTNSRASGFRTATFEGDKMRTEKPKKSQESKDYTDNVRWTAFADQFYLSALIPSPSSGNVTARLVRDRHPRLISQDEDSHALDLALWVPRPELVFAAPAIKAGDGFSASYSLYLGPQEVGNLKALGVQLEKALDLGMFEFISFYLLLLMKWFYGWCHNWGLAVILLSVLVKLVLWWPTHSSYKNMSQNNKKMQSIQPKLEALKRKYANDKQKQNEETMKLYQEANINFTSGCLPMVLQMPVFFALYSLLAHAIELRGAPFALWIQDLSLKDPYYVLPLVMGVTMFVQQRLTAQNTPNAAGGQQKFMMWFFPIFLTFISFQWPAGLLLYWVVTNLLSLVQQRMVNRATSQA